ncbi:coproporphyrinogen dehydrogenase HemZ [Alkalibacter mobilis]|uniref:coproporphyrinogen dehydrogenase HemZ n=1 Tax=Alkalibacter mobilis TaxID=2787712 RepID=UPI00189FC613|nr:coproporphyrinogen dehydrogenase HemZ [Alkalibacter mobilis]MBF7095881.1 coproporphyrinogen dehydrogenase HemZ [Alkalibacter mobilis]
MGNAIYLDLTGDIFENDVREIMMSFFPGYPIVVQQKLDKSCEKNFLKITKTKTSMHMEADLLDFDKYEYKQLIESKLNERHQLKIFLYDSLSIVTGRKLKWGTLTGIRPARIAHKKLLEGKSCQGVLNEISTEYRVGGRETEMLVSIAKKEIRELYPLNVKKYSLYINIPFCPGRCSYCSFITYDAVNNEQMLEKYLESLVIEIEKMGKFLNESAFELETVYVGGGTPTVLNKIQIHRLMKAIHDNFDTSSLVEFTFEAGRPDTITNDKLDVLKEWNIDRISINPQTFNENTLNKIGRSHSIEEFRNAFKMVKAHKFRTVNCDMIIGLEDENSSDMIETAIEISKLEPENITVHSLSLKNSSRLKKESGTDFFSSHKDVDHAAKTIYDIFVKSGYEPYYMYRQKYSINNGENIGYAKEGHNGIYNMAIMSDKRTIIGLGAGSSGKLYSPSNDRLVRLETVKNLSIYIEDIEKIVERKIMSVKSGLIDVDMK